MTADTPPVAEAASLALWKREVAEEMWSSVKAKVIHAITAEIEQPPEPGHVMSRATYERIKEQS